MDASIYDCVVDTGNKLFRVQVKSTIKEPVKKSVNNVQVVLANCKSTYTKELIDYFAVWCDYYGGFFIFKNKGNMQTIRLSLIGKNKIYFNNFALI